MKKLDTKVAIRVESTLWQEFIAACQYNDTNASDRLRSGMDNYVERHKQNLRIAQQNPTPNPTNKEVLQ